MLLAICSIIIKSMKLINNTQKKRYMKYIFATNVAPNKDTDLNTFSQVRIELTKDVFKELKIIADKLK